MTHKAQGIGDFYAQKLYERSLLQTGPSTKGLFTGEGIHWAKLKQEPDKETPAHGTQGLSDKICSNVEEMLCWAFEIAIQEKRRKNWH